MVTDLPQIIHNCAHWSLPPVGSWPLAVWWNTFSAASVSGFRVTNCCSLPWPGGVRPRRDDPGDVRQLPFQGDGDLGAWIAPNELPIHRVLLSRRPTVTAVVHAHPTAYDIPGARLAADGIPTWDRSALIRTDELAGAMAEALGDRPIVILRGHGIVSVAEGDATIAVQRAVRQSGFR